MKEPDLGFNLKPASDSRSPGDLGKCLQGPGPDWGQEGILHLQMIGLMANAFLCALEGEGSVIAHPCQRTSLSQST